MQLQIKPRLYADHNKQMDESYYNYEAYEIEYGYDNDNKGTLKTIKLSTKSERGSIPKCTQASM